MHARFKVPFIKDPPLRYKPALCLIILLVGCATMEHVVIGPPRVLSVEEIQADVSTNAQKISTLKAKVELTVASRDLTGPLICSGYVRMERPKRLRIVCSKLFTTLFDVVSDGHEFWLYIPKEKKVYKGLATQEMTYLGLHFSPNDVAGLLDFQDALTGEVASFETRPKEWSIYTSDSQGNRQAHLVVERHNLHVLSYESFSPDGSLRMHVTLGDYKKLTGCSIPRSIEVYWPKADTRLFLRFSHLDLNEEIDPRVFHFSMPQDAQVIHLSSNEALTFQKF